MAEPQRSRGTRRGRQHLASLGAEMRNARRAAGLTQAAVAEAAGISRAELSRIERQKADWLDVVTAAELCAVLGLDLWLRVYPGGDPLRDAAHAGLIARFLDRIRRPLAVRVEVPLPGRGDPRAWDATVSFRDRIVAVEAETRLTDLQAMERRLALKRRDGGIDQLIIVVADTRANRDVLRSARPGLRLDYPLDTEAIETSLAAGRLPSAGGIALL